MKDPKKRKCACLVDSFLYYFDKKLKVENKIKMTKIIELDMKISPKNGIKQSPQDHRAFNIILSSYCRINTKNYQYLKVKFLKSDYFEKKENTIFKKRSHQVFQSESEK
jgi:hypothetical protein